MIDFNSPLMRHVPRKPPANRDDYDADNWLLEELCRNPKDISTIGELSEVCMLNNRFWRATYQRRTREAIQISAMAAGLTSAVIALLAGLSPLLVGLSGLLVTCASGFVAMTLLWIIAGFHCVFRRPRNDTCHD